MSATTHPRLRRRRRRQEARRARIEIIPLIDIMFFLLASFMLVSISMVQMRGVKIALPTASASASSPERWSDFVTITVDALGRIYLENEEVDPGALRERVRGLHAANADLRVYVRGDQEARHGTIVTVLDRVRAAGVAKVAFEIKGEEGGSRPSPSPSGSPSAGGHPEAGRPSAATAAAH